MTSQEVKHVSPDESLIVWRDLRRTGFLILALALAVYLVAGLYTSTQQATVLGVSTGVSCILNSLGTLMSQKGRLRGPLIVVVVLASLGVLLAKPIRDHIPPPLPATTIVGVQQGNSDDRVFGAFTDSTRCNPAELVLVTTAPEDRDYFSPVRCVGKNWEAPAPIGRRDAQGKFNPVDAKATYTLRVFSGPKETVLQAIKGQLIPSGLMKISGDVDKGFTPGPFVVNDFRLIQ